ncbi:MAG: hypothetical protein ABL891_06315 [Burkholderiales bacterium]
MIIKDKIYSGVALFHEVAALVAGKATLGGKSDIPIFINNV